MEKNLAENHCRKVSLRLDARLIFLCECAVAHGGVDSAGPSLIAYN